MYKTEKSFDVIQGKVPVFGPKKTLVEYLLNTKDTDENLETFQHVQTNQTPALTDYRYIGKNPNNYVCFGSDSTPCPEENLYRIIGIIPTQNEENGIYEDKVKLIRSVPTLHLDYGINNQPIYENSTPYKYLNETFYNDLGEAQTYIDENIYFTCYSSLDQHTVTPNQFYTAERGSTSYGQLKNKNYIGLIYPSDYGYSLGNQYNNTSITSHVNDYHNSWLSIWPNVEFTILSSTGTYISSILVWVINVDGNVWTSRIWDSSTRDYFHQFYVRPTFYLKKEVLYKSGEGTQDKPYRIEI